MRDKLLAKATGDVELVKGANGVFEVFADGKLVFSKKELGRFPTDEEIDRLIA